MEAFLGLFVFCWMLGMLVWIQIGVRALWKTRDAAVRTAQAAERTAQAAEYQSRLAYERAVSRVAL